MNGGEDQGDQGQYDQHDIQQAEQGPAAVLFHLKQTKCKQEKEKRVGQYDLAANNIRENMSGKFQHACLVEGWAPIN